MSPAMPQVVAVLRSSGHRAVCAVACAAVAAIGGAFAIGAAAANAELAESSLATIPSPWAVTARASTTHSTATMTGTVFPGGSENGVRDTHYHFEYGTSTQYGSSTTEGDSGSELVGKVVVMQVGGLSPGTTYHYRLVATNSSGTSEGADATFKTRGWSIQTTPNAIPHGLSGNYGLEVEPAHGGVSCWAANGCVAVGFYTDTEEQFASLVELWNGTTWEVQASPNPAGATGTFLEAVSCRSSSECTATGYYESSAGGVHHTLSERWNGSTWQVQSTPTEGNANLGSVSCGSASECVAVGRYVSGSPAKTASLVEIWNGQEWKVQESAKLPTEDEDPRFEGVSCAAARQCTAVGSVTVGLLGIHALAESWNGSTWSLQTTPVPNAERSVDLYLLGVSCSSPSACTAVGHYNEVNIEQALVERWNGTAWQIQESPSPIGQPKEGESHWELSKVSCASAASCVAVGSYSEKASASNLLGEQWNGTSWELESPSDRTGVALDVLGGVSCSSVAICTTVGSSWKSLPFGPQEALAERLEEAPTVETKAASDVSQSSAILNATVNPHGETVSECKLEYGASTAYGSNGPCTPMPGGGQDLAAVSAAISGLSANTTYHFRISVTSSFGTSTGSDQTFTTPANTFTQDVDSATSLNAVSCVSSTTDCTVSDSRGNAFYTTNVSASSSATWTAWSGPGTSPSEAVDCPASSLCLLADGGNLYSAPSLGGSWTVVLYPIWGVDAISCASSSFCVEGQNHYGFFRYSTSPASASWNIEDQGSAAMSGVSCLSSSFCAIVDNSGNVHVATTTSQIESASWKVTNVDGSSALNGVACISTTLCVAIDGAGNVLELTMSSEGIATASKNDIDGTNDLTAVSCAANSTTCTTVDNQGNIFVSHNGGATWTKDYTFGDKLTSVSCASTSLCVAVDTTGNVNAFNVPTTPTRPSVETNPATNITEAQATLNGVVNPQGANTKYYFEYGTTTSYGAKTFEVGAGSGATNVEESQPLTGLAASTTYHFRIVATNGNGTTDGADRQFTAAA
jgi:hypothetical protein